MFMCVCMCARNVNVIGYIRMSTFKSDWINTVNYGSTMKICAAKIWTSFTPDVATAERSSRGQVSPSLH